jgi:putative transposase
LNRKRLTRRWPDESLRGLVRRRKRQRLGKSTVPASRFEGAAPNQGWALDSQYDQTAGGRIVRLLRAADEFLREALAMVCERRIDTGCAHVYEGGRAFSV